LSSVLEYKQLDLQIPTINIVGGLVKSGVPVLVYRCVTPAFSC
jgi:serine carboxypeptidase-like clade 2